MANLQLSRDQSGGGAVGESTELPLPAGSWGRYVGGKPTDFEPFGGDERRRVESGWAFAWYVGGGFLQTTVLGVFEGVRSGEVLLIPAGQAPRSLDSELKLFRSTGLGCEPLPPIPFRSWVGLVESGAVVHLDRPKSYLEGLHEMVRLLEAYQGKDRVPVSGA